MNHTQSAHVKMCSPPRNDEPRPRSLTGSETPRSRSVGTESWSCIELPKDHRRELHGYLCFSK